jgi:hypothetical protein
MSGRPILGLRFEPWVPTYARLMGSLGGGPKFEAAVVGFVRLVGVRRVV